MLLEREMTGWQWYQLDHTQIICTSLQTDNHASASPLSFLQANALPATQPTASKHWRQKYLTNSLFWWDCANISYESSFWSSTEQFFPPRKGHSNTTLFPACLLWPQSSMSATAELLFSWLTVTTDAVKCRLIHYRLVLSKEELKNLKTFHQV